MHFRTVTEIQVWETPWSDLPEHICTQFRENEKLAYVKGAIFFKEAAARLEEPAIESLFELLDDDHPMWVYIETENNGPPLIWFGFTYSSRLVHQPQFRLDTNRTLSISLPPRLKRLYSIFSGFRYSRDDCGGLLPPERVEPLSAIAGRPLKNAAIDAGEYYGIFSYGNGDDLCLNALGDCIAFDHEQPIVHEFELDAALNDMLRGMLQEHDFKKMFGVE